MVDFWDLCFYDVLIKDARPFDTQGIEWSAGSNFEQFYVLTGHQDKRSINYVSPACG